MEIVPEDGAGCQFFLPQVHGDLMFSIPRTQTSECVLSIHHEYTLHPLGPACISSKLRNKEKTIQVAVEYSDQKNQLHAIEFYIQVLQYSFRSEK